jgi:transitional endoplasmic reticulum ATPase
LSYPHERIEPDDILSKYINESAENVGEIFEAARENSPCLVFIDELDGIASERGGRNKHQDQDNTVNQLLNELSEVNESDDEVVVVAATNKLDEVDEAARRSGRFDKKVEVPPPDKEARKEILKVHLESRPTEEDIDYNRVAEETEGMVASDVELVAENAAREAMFEDEPVGTEYLLEAVGGVRR